MIETKTDGLPDLGAVLAQLLQRVAPPQQPLLIALAERLAAERYRGWSARVDDTGAKAELLACAAREEEIAARVERMHPDAAAIQQQLQVDFPDLLEINRNLFADLSLADQFTLQARGERLGAATWRALASATKEEGARASLLSCAELEEQSALVLEALVATPHSR